MYSLNQVKNDIWIKCLLGIILNVIYANEQFNEMKIIMISQKEWKLKFMFISWNIDEIYKRKRFIYFFILFNWVSKMCTNLLFYCLPLTKVEYYILKWTSKLMPIFDLLVKVTCTYLYLILKIQSSRNTKHRYYFYSRFFFLLLFFFISHFVHKTVFNVKATVEWRF